MGKLTTHVLDTARGRPASGVAIELQRWNGESWRTIARSTTNANGRCDAPLLPEATTGAYQLLFHVGEYFREIDGTTEASSFLDIVPIRFNLSEQGGHYHVPLVVSPWSYSTYRGS